MDCENVCILGRDEQAEIEDKMETTKQTISKMKKPICYWCGEKLTFVPGKGWLHPDGKLYKTKIINGEEVDDHCALPIFK